MLRQRSSPSAASCRRGPPRRGSRRSAFGHRGGAAADHALDAVLDHEVEPARAGADDGLPALDRPVIGRGTSVSSAARSRDRAPPAAACSACPGARRTPALNALTMISTCSSKRSRLASRPASARRRSRPRACGSRGPRRRRRGPGENVGGRVVLGQPQRMPHGRDVEAAADPELLGEVRQVHRQHQDVRDALVALVLEVVLGQPERVVAELVHHLARRPRSSRRPLARCSFE